MFKNPVIIPQQVQVYFLLLSQSDLSFACLLEQHHSVRNAAGG